MLMKKEIIEDNKKLKEEIEKLKRLYETDRVSASEIIAEQDKEIGRLNGIIKNTTLELEILLQSKDFELIIMQLRNIVFRLKGVDKQ